MRIPRELVFQYDKFFHVFNKFNPELCLDESNLDEIQKIIEYETLSKPEIKIVASNILNNHFHLLLSVDEIEFKKRLPDEERLGISIFMQKIGTKIAKYVNKVKKRHGKVFYDRYKAKLVDSTNYFRSVFNYITNNSKKHYKILKEKWKYSSFHFYNKTLDFAQNFITHYKFVIKKALGVSHIDINSPFLPSQIIFLE